MRSTVLLAALLPTAMAFFAPCGGVVRRRSALRMQDVQDGATPEVAKTEEIPTPTPVTSATPPTSRRVDLVLDAKLAAKEVEEAGVSAPLGFFDPLGFYKDKTIRQKKKLREAELKHGRIAMLAFLGVLVQEFWHPLIPGDIGPAAFHFQQASEEVPDLAFYFLIGASLGEAKAIISGWDPVDETLAEPKIAGLRDSYVAGALDFDPLGFMPDEEEPFLDMRTRELNNGRLAMIGWLGAIVQELITGQPLFG